MCSRCGDTENWTVIAHRRGEDPRYLCLLCVADEIVELEAEHKAKNERAEKEAVV